MADPRLMDQAFQRLMRSLVESGRARTYFTRTGISKVPAPDCT